MNPALGFWLYLWSCWIPLSLTGATGWWIEGGGEYRAELRLSEKDHPGEPQHRLHCNNVPQPILILHLLLAKWKQETERLRMCFLSQDALSLLAENAELSDEDGRGVAFRRAAAVLKALHSLVTDLLQLRGLPCLGGHSLRVIKVSGKISLFISP